MSDSLDFEGLKKAVLPAVHALCLGTTSGGGGLGAVHAVAVLTVLLLLLVMVVLLLPLWLPCAWAVCLSAPPCCL